MTHRERFKAVVTHRQADRAVFDLCGSPQTLIDYQETKDRMAENVIAMYEGAKEYYKEL